MSDHDGSSPSPSLILNAKNAATVEVLSTPTHKGDGQTQPLSKNAQKRLAKAAYVQERKKERRAAEKERRKEKKRILADKRAAGELEEEEEDTRTHKRRKTDQNPKTYFGARVVIDLGFDDKMTENEIKSLTSQLAYTYSANRKTQQPFSSLLFTSLNGRTLERMDSMNQAAYKRWVGAEWWQGGYERLWEGNGNSTDELSRDEGNAQEPAADEETVEMKSSRREPSRAQRETIVYLTADSEDELTELREDETYIIGGIVDHNRYKNLCLNKSKEHQIRSARLPIGTYLAEMRTRKVLTVNQTFEILLKWVETRDWEQALHAVMPKRKFSAEGRRRGGRPDSPEGEEHDEKDQEEQEEETMGADKDARVLDVTVLETEI